MDWLKFVAELVDSIAWPATIVVVILVFREPLTGLFPNLRRLKYKDFEAEFAKDLDALKTITPLEISSGEETDDRLAALRSEMMSLATFAPNSAVLETWRAVERAAKELIDRRGVSVDYDVPAPYRLIQKVLRTENILETKRIRVFNELRKLRNKVAHADDYEITTPQAQDYINLALSIISEIDAL